MKVVLRGLQLKIIIRKISLLICIFVICVFSTKLYVKAEESSLEDDTLIVAIDAGHSGTDFGAVGRYGGKLVTERETNLKIAKAMKKELDTYKGVKAILTRTDNETEWDISGRVEKALAENADIIISLHSNANGGIMAYSGGACVIVSEGQYRPLLAKLEQGLGKVILNELSRASGVKNQGLLTRTARETRYPNGTLADYYQLTRQPVMEGIPSVVIEHCFIDNYYDYMKCLSSNSKIAALGKADATAVAKYFGLEKKDGSVSYKRKGKIVKYLTRHWVMKGNSRYYIQKDGSFATGWNKIKNRYYYFKKNGQVVTGWIKINGELYCFDKRGRALSGKKTVERKGQKATYYFTKRGKVYKGWKKLEGKWYYFSEKNGKLIINMRR